ncbi:MAG TPA: biotin--[acetyl-CoA-carboxylase] ligase [Chitinophagaceae bacterium]|mgnify:CR=1 FL=1|nr:biotin--[acetyl-CoA-carboxylase] ligase [Chitinophagaceae bacterium]
MQHPDLPDVPGSSFIELQSVDSTNNYARKQIDAKLALHGMIVFAHHQEAGKGQRGKSWLDEPGNNIAVSIILKPDRLSLSDQFRLTACIANAVCRFFSKYAGDDTKIKWPNDLYWQDRKAGGILIESIISNSGNNINKWDWAIAGIGININQVNFPEHLPNPVSLKQITGKNFDPVQLTKELAEQVLSSFHQLTEKGFESIYKDYLELLYKKNETVKFKKGNRVFEAMVTSVTPQGKLLLHHSIDEEFSFGEIEWVI